MKISSISWVGVKTSDFSGTRDFFSAVMGMQVVFEHADFAVLKLPSGDLLEVFGPEGPDPEFQFRRNEVVAGFEVDDMGAARDELVAGGAELLGEIQEDPGGHQWQHFRTPDGKVFELNFNPESSSAS